MLMESGLCNHSLVPNIRPQFRFAASLNHQRPDAIIIAKNMNVEIVSVIPITI